MYRFGGENMKVFVSWSGEQSQRFAEALKEWLEQCIQSVEVFFSSEDIEKGDNWQIKLANELQDTNYGIVCLTPENIDAPWIHFEAGALSKMLDSKVMVLAMDINFADIKGPLKAFQATKLESNDIFKLLKTINSLQEKPLSDEKLKNSFDAFWPQFQKKIEKIKRETINDGEDRRASKVNVSGTVDEILQIVRSQNAIINNPERLLPIEYLDYVFRRKGIINDSEDRILDELFSFTKYFISEFDEIDSSEKQKAFWESYNMMIKRIIVDNPMWKRRFSSLMYERRKKVDIDRKESDENS